MFSLLTLRGAATLRARSIASVTVFSILFTPATRMTFSGPKVMAATRLPVPSMLTSQPSREMPLIPAMKLSASSPLRIICLFSAGSVTTSRSMSSMSVLALTASMSPIWTAVTEPPHATVSPAGDERKRELPALFRRLAIVRVKAALSEVLQSFFDDLSRDLHSLSFSVSRGHPALFRRR